MWIIRQTNDDFSRVWGKAAEFDNELAALDSLVNDFDVVTYIMTLSNGALVYSCSKWSVPGRVYVIVKEK